MSYPTPNCLQVFICARSAADVDATVQELRGKGHKVFVSAVQEVQLAHIPQQGTAALAYRTGLPYPVQFMAVSVHVDKQRMS